MKTTRSSIETLTLALLPALVLTTAASGQEAADTTAAPLPDPVPAEFNTDAIVPQETSYLVMFQGTEIGDMTISTAVDGDLVTTSTVLDVFVQGTSIYQESEAQFRTDPLGMVSSTMSADMMGTAMESRVMYEDGRVSGEVQNPGPTGLDTVVVDTTLAPGTLGTGALPALMLTLDLSEGAAYSVSAFEPASQTVRDMVFRVTEAGQTTVADGTFDTWTVTMEGSQAAMAFYVRQSDRKVIKMIPVGQPVEFVLAGAPPE